MPQEVKAADKGSRYFNQIKALYTFLKTTLILLHSVFGGIFTLR